MLQIKQVVNRVFSSNTYIVFDEDLEDCCLVDIGDFEMAIHSLPENKKVAGVILTHTHFDHIYGLNDLCKRFPDCVVYTSQFGSEALMNDKKNLSRYHEHPIIFDGKNLQVVKDGDELLLFGNERIVVKETPGHDPGCLTYFTDSYIFTGDSFIPGAKVVTKLPGGDKRQAAESIRIILELAKGRTVCPGHGDLYSA